MTDTATARPTPAPGHIVVEPATGRRYAIGTKGFLDLTTGDFLSYDSAFPGPQFFDRDDFTIETPATPTPVSEGVAEAIEEADYAHHRLAVATNLGEQTNAYVRLLNAMSDLRTWHPGHDTHTGTLPWERADSDD